MNIHKIETITDILKLSVEEQDRFLKELPFMLNLYALAFDVIPENVVLEWTDDGECTSKIINKENGEEMISLVVTEGEE